MNQIGTAGNSETACVRMLIVKGYKLTSSPDGPRRNCIAKRDNDVYIGCNFIEVAGLAALGEMWSENWSGRKFVDGDPWDLVEDIEDIED